MSHQVLARKWRPQTFTDIVGQEHVVTALVNALKTNRLHHAYLFSGTRGVGKTTIARVLAKALSCETGITSEPCGQCEFCEAIVEGRFIDLIEVDAASRTKVEDTRELLENVQYAPTRGRFKIYLIDEVHMLSGHSFNALLKTLEEPPEHVKFLLATTDPQKLPVTVLSRCLQFTLRHISTEKITNQLEMILQQEKINSDKAALIELAESASGSMRDALSLLDQAISYSDGEITEQTVNQMLGTVPSEQVNSLVTAICNLDAVKSMQIIQELATLNVEFGKLLDQLIMIFHAAAISQAVPEYEEKMALFESTVKLVSDEIDAEDIQLFYQIALTSRKDLYLAHSARAGFEMAVLRMIMFRPAAQERQPSAKRVRATRAVSSSEAVGVPEIREKSAKPDVRAIEASWQEIIGHLKLNGVAKVLATHCELKSSQDCEFKLTIATEHQSLLTDAAKAKLENSLKDKYGDSSKLLVTVSKENVDSPARQLQDKQIERMDQAQSSLEEDDFVKALKQDFQAEIVPGSVQLKPGGE
ncbi:MAG: DNA polymerase III subunit gamma/tau [Pseudomonadota bacterium]